MAGGCLATCAAADFGTLSDGRKTKIWRLQSASGFIVDISQVDKGLVRLGHSSDVPYALRLYLHPEYNFNKDKNPNAQGMWFRPWLKHGEKSKRVREIYEELLKREI